MTINYLDFLKSGDFRFVLDHCSIIGTISALNSRTALVRLVTDHKSRIVERIAELDVGAIMQGGSSSDYNEFAIKKKNADKKMALF